VLDISTLTYLLGWYAISPGNMVYYYAELTVCSRMMAVTTASTHFAYPCQDDQTELA